MIENLEELKNEKREVEKIINNTLNMFLSRIPAHLNDFDVVTTIHPKELMSGEKHFATETKINITL